MSKSATEIRNPAGFFGTCFVASITESRTPAQNPAGSGSIVGVTVTVHGADCALEDVAGTASTSAAIKKLRLRGRWESRTGRCSMRRPKWTHFSMILSLELGETAVALTLHL